MLANFLENKIPVDLHKRIVSDGLFILNIANKTGIPITHNDVLRFDSLLWDPNAAALYAQEVERLKFALNKQSESTAPNKAAIRE